MRTTFSICLALLLWPLTGAAEPPVDSPVAEEPVNRYARDTFRVHTTICPFRNQVSYEPGEIECGLLEVPENREDPASRFIELLFVKINADLDAEKDDDEKDAGLAPGKRDDPVVYFTGGPGVQVLSYVKRLKKHRLVRHRDLYILEQRGIGRSGEFCPFYAGRQPEMRQAETYEAYLQAQVDAAAACARGATRAGVDLKGYNTIENARDVKALRQGLGIKTWNVWGISYGSILGQAYVREDPEGIRAMALDAIVPLDAGKSGDAHWRIVKWYDRNLKKLATMCEADSDCAERYPDLGGRVRQAAQKLINNPIVVEVKDKERYPSGKARVFQDTAALLPFALFYEQDNYPALPAIIHAWVDILDRRDETFFKALTQVQLPIAISQGMYDTIFCLDGYVDSQVAAARADLEAFPVLALANRNLKYFEAAAARCRAMGLAPRDSSEYALVETDIPTLIIEGAMDPITPPPLAKAILPGFSRGTYVEFPYAGHGPSRSVDCAGDMLNKFYDNPTGKPDLSCVETMKSPELFVPFFHTALGPRLLLAFAEDKKSLAAPGLWLGLSALIVLLAFLSWSVLPLVRRLDHAEPLDTRGATWAAWAAALWGSAAVGILGGAIGVTYDTAETLLLFGLVPWARFAAYAGVLTGALGLATLVLTVRARLAVRLPVLRLVGLGVTGLAAVALSAFFLAWDLGPF